MIKMYVLYKTSILILDLYSASSLKQQTVSRHVAPLGHIILNPSHEVFALTRGEHAHHYNTDTFERSQ